MKRCCPGAVWVVLAALWLAASASQPLGYRHRAVPRQQQVLVRPPPRLRRNAKSPVCPPGMNWIVADRRCCKLCPAGESHPAGVARHGRPWHTWCIATGGHLPVPAGTFLFSSCSSLGNDSICHPCLPGTFRTQPNTFKECQACYECAQHAFQSVLSNCSSTRNVACGCKPGYFRECLDKHCSDFSCQQCQSCTGRLIQQPCSEMQDTRCGSCKPDFYAEGNECRPCHMSTPETCSKECQRVCGSSSDSQGAGMEYLILALTGPLFLGALAIYRKRKRRRHDALANSSLPTTWAVTPTPGTAATPWHQVSVRGWDNLCWTQSHSPQPTDCTSGTAKQSPKDQALLWEQPGGTAQPGGEAEPSAVPEPCSALLQGSQLYAVINAVPVRRWKEFMRVLELREAEIELVELEVAHIRDQQYEMLKRWCQQTSATLDRIFAALERMELAGCAEALRRSLQAGP
ncbi:tumor necrosis factor receptor superfamily member 25 isoform X2 [Colius striatus]|uniref:tumor necrosis factor receptor superfamily member 25 isoform X2 n=1 Tax=Colius striatus TaxID=57412 RepID=UPI002B1D7E31|nr:tumor necrosis factor receptor superfamily member 25 isoform X2 [Colius striatus]